MKKQAIRSRTRGGGEELRVEYRFDYGQSAPSRFASRVRKDAVVVVLDADVAKVFSDSRAVNDLLRSIARARASRARKKKPDRTKLANKALQRTGRRRAPTGGRRSATRPPRR